MLSLLFFSTPLLYASADPVPEGLEKSDWQEIRSAHETWQHEFREAGDGWQARNPGQRWTTRFDGRGFTATPDGASWTWGLEFQSYGFGEIRTQISGTPEVRAEGLRLSYQWNDSVEEWFINDQRGLEHGFILKEQPEGGEAGKPLTFTISTLGPLQPTVSKDAQTVHFRDEIGAPVLNYAGLKVWDAEGTVLASRFERGPGKTFRLVVEESGARYPLTIDPIAQQAYLKASNTGAGDEFGVSVAVSGDTVVVGAHREDSGTTGIDSTPDDNAADSGAAYVFVRSGGTWSQQAYLKASNTGVQDNFGWSVAISGDTVVVGAFTEDGSSSGVNGTPDDNAINSGAAYVFVRNGSTWSQQAYLKASNPGTEDRFGVSVAVSGNTVIVGASLEDSNTTGVNSTPDDNALDSGAAYIFVRSGSNWSQQAYLKAFYNGTFDNFDGAFDSFGVSVAVSGDTVIVGAHREDSSTTGVDSTADNNAANSGAAYVFSRSGSTWSQQAYLKASNTGANDRFGYSVALDGDTAVVGAYSEDSGTTGVNSTPDDNALHSGAAYVFVRGGGLWSQQAYLKASNTQAGDEFGFAVAVSGDAVVVGAYLEDSGTTGVNSTPDDNAADSGAAYVFVRSGGTWSQQAYLKASNTGFTDRFGRSVAVSEDTVAVGALLEDSDNAGNSGASYIFTGLGASEIAVEAPTGTEVENAIGTLAFAQTDSGQSDDQLVTIRNYGGADLNGILATVTGQDASQFEILSTPPASLAGGGTVEFTVRFSPTSPGAKTATLSIASDDSDENPFTVGLTGSGEPLLSSRNEILLLTSGTQLLAFDADDGTSLGNFISGHVPAFAYDVEIGPDGHIYLLDFGDGFDPSSIHRYDGQTGDYLGQVMQTSGFKMESFTFHPDGSILAPNPNVGVLRYDSQTGQLLGTLIPDTPEYSSAAGLMADENGVFASYAGGTQGGSVYRFDPATGGNPTALATGLPGNGPRSPFRVPSGEIFVPVWQSNFIATFAADTLARGADRSSHGSALGLALSPDGQLLSLIFNGSHSFVQKIDLTSGDLIETLIPAGSGGLDQSVAFARHSILLSPLFYTIGNGKVTIRQCDPSASGQLVIPDTIDELPVTAIGDGAFENNGNLTRVIIPGGVTSIGNDAFRSCTKLRDVIFLGDAPTMGTSAFFGTSPEFSVYFNTGASGFTTPTWEGYPAAAYQAPSFDTQPASVTINEGNGATLSFTASGNPTPEIQWYEGASGDVSNPISGANGTSYSTPALSSTTSYWVKLSSLSAVAVDSNTATVTVETPPPPRPDLTVEISAPGTATTGVAFIYTITARNTGNFAASGIQLVFDGPSGLTVGDVTTAGGFARLGSGDDPFLIFTGGNLAAGAEAVLTIAVSSAIEATYSTALASVVIDSSESVVESNESNNNSTQVISTVVSAPPEFSYTSANGEITITGYLGTSTTVAVPATIEGLPVTVIGTDSFRNKSGITGVTLPASITSIGNNAFQGCLNLTNINFPAGLTSIGNSAFFICDDLDNVILPDGLISIGNGAFQSCKALSSITIPDSVETIGINAFNSCSALTQVILPSGLERLSANVFLSCSGLTSITIPESVLEIDAGALSFCSGLSSITIPVNVVTIGARAFQNCTNLSSVTLPEGLSSLGSDVFTSCSSLTSIAIPNGITSIPGRAFKGCSALTEITLPDNLTSIGNFAFELCSSLVDIVIPDSVTTINTGAFGSCSSLANITIPASVTTMGIGAFGDCTALASALFLGNAPSMGATVFDGSATGFTVYYKVGAADFTTPTWEGYPSAIFQDASVITQPSGTVVPNGGTATLSVTVSGNPLPVIQWYVGVSGDTSNPIPGATGASYTTPALDSTTSYWVRLISLSGTTTDSNTATVETPPSPVAHWKFDEITGTTAADSAGSFDGTLSGSASFVPGGISGNAISLLNAGNSLVNMGNMVPGFASGNFTIAAWIKTTATNSNAFFAGKHLSGSGNGYILAVNSLSGGGAVNKATFYASGQGANIPFSSTKVNDGTWHQVIGVYTAGGNAQIYVDGVLEDTRASPTMVENTVSFLIGGATFGSTPTNLYEGLVDDVQLYSSALSESDITFLFGNPGQPLSNQPPAAVADFQILDANEGTIRLDGSGSSDPDGTIVSYEWEWLDGENNASGETIDVLFPYGDSEATLTVADNDGATSTHTIIVSNPAPEYNYIAEGGQVSILRYNGTGGAVIIPSIIEGQPVTVIGAGAFENNTDLTSITIPESVTGIGDNAFRNCSDLAVVNLPEGLLTIGFNAFHSCVSLTRIVIPGSVTDIFGMAFQQCNNLTAAFFLGNAPFLSFSSFNGAAPGFGIYYPQTSTGFTTPTWRGFPASVFQDASITAQPQGTSITEGSSTTLSVTAQGNPTPNFQWYRGASGDTTQPLSGETGSSFFTPTLTSTTSYWVQVSNFPDTTLNSNTATVTVNPPPPASPDLTVDISAPTTAIANIAYEYTITANNIGDQAASGIELNFTVPPGLTVNGVTTAGGFTRQGTGNNSVFFIGGSLAGGASAILKVSVTSTTGGTYSTFAGSATIDPSDNISESNDGNNSSQQIVSTVVSVPLDYTYTTADGEVTITGYTGTGGSIAVPETIDALPVTVIGNNAFSGTTSITAVTLPNSITSIGANAFSSCVSLTTINLPPNLTSIGDSAFFTCPSLTNLSFPPNLSSIGTSAFQSCTSLTNINLPPSVTSIGPSAFRACTEVTSVTIPTSITTLEASVFRACSNLISVSLPASVTNIENDAFRGCTLMDAAFFQGNAPSMGTDVFAGTAVNFTVFFLVGNTGFTTPTWLGYPTVGLEAPSITTEPASQMIATGSTAMLTVVAAGNPSPSYQWYRGDSGNTSQPIGGATNSGYTTPALTETTRYWVRASNSHGTADSQTAEISIASGQNANLADLSLDTGSLSPGFNQLTTNYSATVPNAASAIRVIPTAAASGAGIEVNGVSVVSGTGSNPIPLGVGDNLIEIVVTAPDLVTKKTYSVNVLRSELPAVTTDPATNVATSGGILQGTVDPNGSATVYFEYGTTTSYGSFTPPQFLSGVDPVPFQAPVSGLPGSTTIHFRAVASQGGVIVHGDDRSFTTLPAPVFVVTGNPLVTGETAARFVGAVNTQGQEVVVRFEYGTTMAYGNATPPRTIPAGSGLQDVLEDVTGLIAGATYHVRLVVTSPLLTEGNDVVFEVEVVDGSGTGTPTAVPAVITGDVVDVQDDAGTLKGTVNANGGSTTAYFQYGTTPSYGQVTAIQPIGNDTLDAEVSIPAENLLPGTRYYYRLMAENSLGLSAPGAEAFFDTDFSPPLVITGAAEALNTTSVRVSGAVRARNTDTAVEIIFGTNPGSLSDGETTSPALVTGDEQTQVSADLENLLQSVTYYYRVRAVNSGGTTLGALRTFRLSTLSGLLQVFPDEIDPADHTGSLQVNITPGGIGAGWRLSGEQAWRLPGETMTGLTSGDRVVEYRAISGYLPPSSETVTIVSGDPTLVLARTYTSSGATGSGSLTVNLKPDTIADPSRPVADRTQWRLLGENDSAWKDSGAVVAGLPPGNHVVECKPIVGRSTPPPASVVISDGATASVILTYYEADPSVGDLPEVLDFDPVRGDDNLPFAYVGQIRSDAGSSTGFVVRPRVVATVAHAVFDDGTLASATGLQWLFQRHRDIHEPTPMIPRGFYTLTGYAAQRAIDGSPGVSTPESQHLDAAAMYFAEEAGRSGFSGYLASDLDENEFLISSSLKTLVGYPIENIAAGNQDRMHATPPENITFTLPTGTTRTFTTDEIRSTGGGSGGPLCVLASNGRFFPAGIYLGGTQQTIVRAIDSDVATLFGFAEVSGNSADGSGSGSITDSETSPVGTPALGSLRVLIEPAGARNAGAGWRIGSGAYLSSGAQLDNLSPNTYGIEFPTVSGFEAPSTPSVEITGGELKTVTFTYVVIVPPPVINSAASVTVNKGDTLEYQTTATNSPTMFSLSGLLPLGTVFDPAIGRITGIAQEAGRFPVVVGVSNSGGTDTRTVEILSLPILAPQSVNAPFEESLEYQIVSSEEGEGVVFEASNLPPGLALDESTGLVSGTPTTPGTYESPVSVTVNGATKASTLTFEITGTAPEITEQPAASTSIEYGENVVLTVTTAGLPAPAIQWYLGNSGDDSQPVSGATEATFVSPPLTSSTAYWARVSNLSGSEDSETAAVTVLPSTNANLSFLSLNTGALSPSFNAEVTAYTAAVPNSITSIRLTPNTAVPVSTVAINGVPSPINTQSDPVALAVGANPISVFVTAQDGTTTKEYIVTVTRAPAPDVITLGSDGINDIRATVRGSVNPRGSGMVFFEYGPTTDYGSRVGLQQVSGTSAVAVSAMITGLSGNRTYHYRVAFNDGGTPVFGDDMTFTTDPERPLVVTGNAAAVSETGATLIGIVNPRGSQTNVRFEYGTAPDSLDSFTPFQDIGTGTRVVEITAPITGLTAGEIYYYRTIAESVAFAQPVFGETKQFTAETTPETGDGLADGPPEVIPGSETATGISTDGAVLEATINPNDGSTLVHFEYGTTPAYGFLSDAFRIGNGTENALVTIPIANLGIGETYFFRAVAENAEGIVTGTGTSFTTSFQNPTVTTGEAVAISSRSARVNGTVNANGTTRDVYFRYGTDGVTFPQSVRAFQQTVAGNLDTPVFVDLVNLEEGVTYFYKVVATDVGEAEGTEGAALPLNASVLLGLLRQAPDHIEVSGRSGQITVNLLPEGTGSWRFSGEQAWRASGETAGTLTEGDRTIEFRPVTGFIQPPAELVTLAAGDPPLVLERDYYESASAASGSLRVNLFPASLSDPGVAEPSRAQWRLADDADTTWKDTGEAITGLPAGNYLVESKAVSGWDQPVLTSVIVTDDDEAGVSITYFESATPSANPPQVVSFETGQNDPDLPYVHVGQVRSASGSHSGFVVKPKVVATVAQAVFDEATLATVTGLQWLQQRDSASHEPKPLEPRGSYIFLGYEAQRLSEDTPGELSIDSLDLNVAALYFFTDAGRGGFSGFLASDETDNEFLTSSEPKILTGYPVGGSAQGRMHATAPGTTSFTWEQGKTFSSTAIRGLGGMAGGPLGVRYEGSAYYPAGIYVGGTDTGYVRAIDRDIIDMFTRAEVSANGGDNNTNGGITQTSVVGNLNATQPGSLKVIIEPTEAVALGAAWQLMPESTLRQGGAQKSGLSPGSYNLALSTVDGFDEPTIQTVDVSGGQLTTVTFTYAETVGTTPLELWRFENFDTYINAGDAADDFDFDSDGETNIEEFNAGTNPKDASDFFEIATAAKTGSTFTTTCPGKAGRTYTLLRNTALTGTWTRLESQGPLADDGTVTLTDTTAPPDKAFYRIEVAVP